MRSLLLFFVFAFILMISACDDFIERKLTGQTITVLAPADSAVLSATSVTFWWEEVKGATKYNIQVVKPSFSNIQYIVADSNVAGDKFTVNLQPGAYQWRIKALNNSTHTEFFTFSFSVDSSLNLGNQTVQLLTPASNTISNQLSQTFTWAPVFYTDDYRFEILSANGNTVYTNAAVTGTSASYTFTTDGVYTWRVRAQNSSSISPYTQARLVLDNTIPTTPVIVSPLNNTTVTNPFTLNWTQPTDNGAIIYDSLYLYADLGQDTLLKTYGGLTTSYTDSLALGDYFWKVRAIDSVNNYSSYTSLYKFTIQ
jgi:uncharacterized protein YegP (UPF0339 family)